MAEVERMYLALYNGGKEIFSTYDPKKKIQATLDIDRLEHEVFSKIEELLETISNEAIDELLSYDWPGNIRELKATMQLAFVIAEDKEIMKEDIRIQRESVLGELRDFGKKTLKEYNREIIESYLAE